MMDTIISDKIDYEALKQEALRSIVRQVLEKTAARGERIGEHHFYITFKTEAEGVKVPGHLREKFPEEMTIAIQHQFWDLEVHEDYFEVILKFSGIPQSLSIPFKAMTKFIDPPANFGLAFEQIEDLEAGEPEPSAPKETAQAEDTDEPDQDEQAATTEDNNVVSLDRFRPK